MYIIDFAGLVGVADEDDVDPVVTAFKEQMQQDEEAFGQILLALSHRSRDVHQAEHDRVRIGQRLGIEAIETDVDRIDIGNSLAPALEPVKRLAQGGDAFAH